MRKTTFHQVLFGCALIVTIVGQGLMGATLDLRGSHHINHIYDGEICYLSLTDLADRLDLEVNYDPRAFEARIKSGENLLVVNQFSSFVRFDDDLRNIVYPVLYRNADFYLPAITAVPLLSDLAQLNLVWDNSNLAIHGASLSHNVLDLRFSPRTNGYLCEIILAHPLEYEILQSEGNWLAITLQGGTLSSNYIASRPHGRAISKIRAFQFDGSAQISLQFRRPISELHHNLASDPDRIQIAVVDTSFDYTALDTLRSPEESDPIDVIVIDAGHGGSEDGAIGPNGTKEKDVVLDIALRLAMLLAADSNLQIILTRGSDTTLLLDERAEIANSAGGELYVSIHANWFEENSVKGAQTFFLAAALNDGARATAMLENQSLLIGRDSSEGADDDELSLILSDLLQTEYLTESQALATEIQTELIKKLKSVDRGIDQAGFFVLNKVYMPSALVEVAFISNKHEEALLGKSSFRQKAAEGICAGIKNFIDKYNRAK